MAIAARQTVTELGKYRLIAQLGRGGMADVNLAIASGPNGSGFSKLAVVKRLRTGLVDDPDFVAMLVDEARITAHLRHPNVVQTLEVSIHEGEPILVMEYLDGQPLRRMRSRAAQQGIVIPREVEYVIITDVLAGLHHAHELVNFDGTPLDVVHRDVTPHNIFVTVDGQVKVLDFGIAKAAGRAAVTQQGIVKGKLRYMSPEQAGGGVIERRSDLFSVGILLWEAATGKRFWGSLEDQEICRPLVCGTYNPSPRSVDPSVPEEIDAICRRALAPNPGDRYATAADFQVDLERFLGDGIVLARRQLGPLVTTLAADERAKLRTIIEDAAQAAGPSLRDPIANSLAATYNGDGSVKPFVVTTPASDTDDAQPTRLLAPPPPSAPRKDSSVAIAFAVLAFLGVVGLSLTVHRVTARAPLPGEPAEVVSDRGALVVSSVGARAPAPKAAPPEPATTTTTTTKPPPKWRMGHSAVKKKGSHGAPAAASAEHPAELSLDTTDPWKAK